MDPLLESFERAPEIVKIRAAATNAAHRRLIHAERQRALWVEELTNAQASYQAEEKEFHTILNRWNPTTNQIENPIPRS